MNEVKFGKYTGGSNIKIVPEQEVFDAQPDALVLLAWHFLPFFLEKFKDYMREGGALVVPLPEAQIYRLDTFGNVYSELLEREMSIGD